MSLVCAICIRIEFQSTMWCLCCGGGWRHTQTWCGAVLERSEDYAIGSLAYDSISRARHDDALFCNDNTFIYLNIWFCLASTSPHTSRSLRLLKDVKSDRILDTWVLGFLRVLFLRLHAAITFEPNMTQRWAVILHVHLGDVWINL